MLCGGHVTDRLVTAVRGQVTVRMSRAERIANLAGVVVPFAGVIVAIVLLWNRAVDLGRYRHPRGQLPRDRDRHHGRLPPSADPPGVRHVPVVGAHVRGDGIALGAGLGHGLGRRPPQAPRPHRRRGRPPQPARRSRLGHRGPLARAHRLADGDPGQADWRKYARDLYEDPAMRSIGRSFPLLVFLSLALADVGRVGAARLHPLGGAAGPGLGRAGPDLPRAPRDLVGQLRVPLFGRRRFDIDDRSTNVAWLSLLSLGESWHHNHHAFPRSATHGLRRWELDPSAWIICDARAGPGWRGT